MQILVFSCPSRWILHDLRNLAFELGLGEVDVEAEARLHACMALLSLVARGPVCWAEAHLAGEADWADRAELAAASWGGEARGGLKGATQACGVVRLIRPPADPSTQK